MAARAGREAQAPAGGNFAHEWHRAGGNTGDLMLLLGWASEDTPRRYGASAAAERAQDLQVKMGIGEKV